SRILPRFGSAGDPMQYRVVIQNQTGKTQHGLWLFENFEESCPGYHEFLATSEPNETERNRFDRAFRYYRWLWLISRKQQADARPKQLPSLAPHSQTQVAFEIKPLRRGIIRLTGLTVARPGPLGLFYARQTVSFPQSTVILSDGCTIIVIILLVYLLSSQRSANFIVVFIQWLPVVLFPIVLAQAYSTSDRIDIRLFFLLRGKKQKAKDRKPILINLTYPYFAVCLVSAGGANVRDGWFYGGVFVLSALALWAARSRRFSVMVWICVMAIGGCTGFVGHIGLHGLQLVLEKKGLEWTSDFTSKDPDPFQTHTAIGDIGTLKPTDRIIFRVTPDTQKPSSLLLREATYNRYLSTMWVAMDPGFKSLKPDSNQTTWHVNREPLESRAITVAASLHKGKGLLKLPDGTFQIERLPVATVEKSKYGTLKVEGGPAIVDYRVHFADSVSNDSAPTEDDLGIPDKEKSALNLIRDQLQLRKAQPEEILKRIESFFLNEFQYSLTQEANGTNKSPLTHFLLDSRIGHCEYFATATVLLLRTAGIPARYGRGYSVHEFSRLENCFIVRARHAHAWTLVYLDGAWHNFDTTPSSWKSIEKAAAPEWQVLADLWSWCRFKLSRAWGWLRQSRIFGYLWWLVVPLVLIPARRLFRKKRVQRIDARTSHQTADACIPAGTDSEFYLIEEALKKMGFKRDPAETLRNWIGRLPDMQAASYLMDDLKPILNLHYRYRFDPRGISASEKASLKSDTQAWLDAYHNIRARRDIPWKR
ncbi:MAG: transglutaminase-like domain-containing protein, partial [Desulfobacterales bacterium]